MTGFKVASRTWRAAARHWPIIALLAVALLLRLPYPDGRSLYAHSELARDLRVTHGLVSGTPVLRGPESSLGGFHFGPAYYYLLLPFAALLGFAPYAPGVASVFFSLATILLAARVVREWFGDRGLSLTVAVVMAASVLDVQIAKYASNPNFVPFFALLFFYAFERLVRDGRDLVAWIALGASLGVVTQLHAVPMIALPLALAAALLLRRIRPSFAGPCVALAVAVAAWAPFIGFQAAHGYPDALALLSLGGAARDAATYAGHWAQFAGFLVAPWVSLHGFFNIADHWGGALFAALAAVGVAAFVAFRTELRRRRSAVPMPTPRSSAVETMVFWTLVPSAVLLAPVGGARDLHVYYFLSLSPLIYVGYAWAFLRARRAGWRMTTAVLAVAFLALQAAQLVQYHVVVSGLKVPGFTL